MKRLAICTTLCLFAINSWSQNQQLTELFGYLKKNVNEVSKMLIRKGWVIEKKTDPGSYSVWYVVWDYKAKALPLYQFDAGFTGKVMTNQRLTIMINKSGNCEVRYEFVDKMLYKRFHNELQAMGMQKIPPYVDDDKHIVDEFKNKNYDCFLTYRPKEKQFEIIIFTQ